MMEQNYYDLITWIDKEKAKKILSSRENIYMNIFFDTD